MLKSSYKLLAIVIILVLVVLNLQKFSQQRQEVVSVWSSYDRDYYYADITTNKGLVDSLKSFFSLENIIYQLTRVRIKAPITYLKREIPLLGYYTPASLQKASQVIYQQEERENKVIHFQFDFEPDRKKEIEKPKRESPLIALYHSHTSETYIDDPRQDFRTHVAPGEIGNVGKVGQKLAEILSEKYQFEVLHTTKVHDQNWTRSYYESRQTVKEIINDYPQVNMILDIHRDGLGANSRELYTTEIKGKKAARIMIIVTTGKFDFANLNLEAHLNWESNYQFANKLAYKMEKLYPGLLMRIETRDTSYNQDLHPRALLLEIGDYTNTTQEALYSASLLADVIAALVEEEHS